MERVKPPPINEVAAGEADHTLFQKILVGIDVGEQASSILKVAYMLKKAFGARIIVCNVAKMLTSFQANDVDGYPANDEERNTLDTLEKMVHSEFGAEENGVEIKIIHGDPAERLSEYSDYLNCDLVLVGSRGHGPLKKALLGSVSSSLASRAKRSVLIVR